MVADLTSEAVVASEGLKMGLKHISNMHMYM